MQLYKVVHKITYPFIWIGILAEAINYYVYTRSYGFKSSFSYCIDHARCPE